MKPICAAIDHWPIRRKMHFAFYTYGLLCVSIVFLWALTIHYMNALGNIERETASLDKLVDQLARDRFEWVDALQKTIILQVQFRGEMDPTKCNFGRSFYSRKGWAREIQAPIKDLESIHLAIHRSAQKIIAGEEETGALYTYSAEVKPLLERFEGKVGEIKEIIGRKQAENRRWIRTLNALTFFAIALFFLVGAALFCFERRVITSTTRALASLGSLTEEIARGNLLAAADLDGRKDEIGKLAESFNRMGQELYIAQRHLVQSEKMSAVGQLAAGIAHEINNPLGVILGFAQSIAAKIKAGDALEVPLRSIEREVVRCKNLVQDLLAFSRADKGAPVPVDLNAMVQAAIGLVVARAKVTMVDIKAELSPDLPGILANANQIQQILVNLCNNAMDAMKEGGTLTITTEKVQETPRSWVCLKVSDTGTGVPEDIQPKIFEPFFTTKPPGKGTGLGLSLVYEMVKKHSGVIELQSRPGRTEFSVKFPSR